MTAGAAQILLKTADLVPQGRDGDRRAGAAAVSRRRPAGARRRAAAAGARNDPARQLRAAARRSGWWPGRRDLAKGLAMIAGCAGAAGAGAARRARIAGVGPAALEGVAWNGGEIAADHPAAARRGHPEHADRPWRCSWRHVWDEAQLCWRPAVDEWGQHEPAERRDRRRRRRHRRGRGGGAVGPPRRARRRAACWAASATPSATARPRRSAPPSPASARSGRFSTRSTGRPTAVLCPRGRGHRLPLRGGDGRRDPPRRPARRAGTEPGQGLHPLRHGAVSGAASAARSSAPIIAAIRGMPIAEVGTFRPRAPYKPITVGALAGLELSSADPSEEVQPDTTNLR